MISPARISKAALLAAIACALSIGAVGCGDDEETTTEPAATTEETTQQTTTAEPTTTSTTTTTTSADQGGVEAPEPKPAGGSAGEGSGGAPAPDTPENDVTPPANTPQGQFEQFCNENPQACG